MVATVKPLQPTNPSTTRQMCRPSTVFGESRNSAFFSPVPPRLPDLLRLGPSFTVSPGKWTFVKAPKWAYLSHVTSSSPDDHLYRDDRPRTALQSTTLRFHRHGITSFTDAAPMYPNNAAFRGPRSSDPAASWMATTIECRSKCSLLPGKRVTSPGDLESVAPKSLRHQPSIVSPGTE